MDLKLPSASDVNEILRAIEAHPAAAFAVGVFTIVLIYVWRRASSDK